MITQLIPPLSTAKGRRYQEALPVPSPELSGTFVGVGFPPAYLIYRCYWDDRAKQGNWGWVGFGPWEERK